MDRTPYRRVTPSRRTSVAEYQREHSATGERNDTVSHAETLIMQCIICGIIMVFVLIAGMTDIAPAATLRSGIRQVLTGAETLDELITEVRHFSNEWLDWQWQPADTVSPDDFYIPAADLSHTIPYIDLEQTMLNDIDYLPPAADEQASNLTVPEPPVTPGLWD